MGLCNCSRPGRHAVSICARVAHRGDGYKQTAGLFEEPGRWEFVLADSLEAFFQSDVPESAFDRGQCFIVVVLEGASHKRWIEVTDVLHAERNRRVVKPPLPVAAAVLSCGHRDDILFLAVLHLHVLAAILGKARYLGWSRRREVKRIVQDQVERSPTRHFAREGRLLTSNRISSRRVGTAADQVDIVIFILGGPMDHRTDIKSTHPCISRAIVEDTKVSPISWQ